MELTTEHQICYSNKASIQLSEVAEALIAPKIKANVTVLFRSMDEGIRLPKLIYLNKLIEPEVKNPPEGSSHFVKTVLKMALKHLFVNHL